MKKESKKLNRKGIHDLINSSKKLTLKDLHKICKYYGITVDQLAEKILSRRVKEGYTEIVVVKLPLAKPPPKKLSSTKKKLIKKISKKKKKKLPKIEYKTVRRLSSKRKIKPNEIRKMALYYNTRYNDGIKAIWFAAAKKGNLDVMKNLYKYKHIKDPDVTDDSGLCAEQLAEQKGHKKIKKWLLKIDVKKINISRDKDDYEFIQIDSNDDEDSSED